MKEQDLFLRRIYTYKGVSVVVDIDLVDKTISLMEKMGDNSFKMKNWQFAHRTHNYLPGWLLILEAMQHAVIEAGKVLAEAEARNEKRFVELLVSLHDMDSLVKKGAKK